MRDDLPIAGAAHWQLEALNQTAVVVDLAVKYAVVAAIL
jgi:hypothetical protein